MEKLVSGALRQPRPPVQDHDPPGGAIRMDRARELALLGRGVAGIRQEVDEDLLELARIALDPDGTVRAVRVEGEMPGAEGRLDRLGGIGEDAPEIRTDPRRGARAGEF